MFNFLHFFSSASELINERYEEECEPTEDDLDNLENLDNFDHSDYVRFKCEYCQIQFDERPDLTNHQEELHQAEMEEEAKSIEARYCKACDRQFKNRVDAYSHVRNNHKKKFMCAKCENLFPGMNKLTKHLKTHRKQEESGLRKQLSVGRMQRRSLIKDNHEEKNKPYAKKVKADLNSTNCSEYVRYVCDYCQIKFDAKPDLMSHQDKSHQAEKEEEARSIEALYCKVCDRQFKNKSAAYDHVRKSHKLRYMCVKCDYVFSNMRGFTRHLKTHRKQIVLENYVSKEIEVARDKCKECKLKFYDSSALVDHWKAVHNQGLSCTVCDQKFEEISLLLNHKQEAHKELTLRNFQNENINEELTCHPCNKTFVNKLSFNSHIKNVHLKSFSCYKCGKVFAHQRDLDAHLIAHKNLEEKATLVYQCDQCGKEFKSQKKLSAHFRCHSSFRCSECKLVYRSQVKNP